MAITRWDPFGELTSMRREMDRLFGRLGFGESRTAATTWMPRVDVKTSGEDMVVFAEIPGLDCEDVEVDVSEGMLTIKGERKSETEKSEEGWLIQERSYGSFERSLALPEGVDPDKITADYKEGVLEVHVPKGAQAVKPATHRVAIGSGEKE